MWPSPPSASDAWTNAATSATSSIGWVVGADAARAAGIPCSLCGELAGNPIATPVLIGLASQFGWMPLIAFGLVHAFGLPTLPAIGLIVMGCSSGGTTSNFFTYLSRADLALSISMTVLSTVSAVAVMPLVLADGAGAASRSAIGIVIASGMSIGTLFTLFVVPAVYTFVARGDQPETGLAEQPRPATAPAGTQAGNLRPQT